MLIQEILPADGQMGKFNLVKMEKEEGWTDRGENRHTSEVQIH